MKNKSVLKGWKGVIIVMLASIIVTIILLYEIVSQTRNSIREETTEHLVEIAQQTKTHIDVRTKISWDIIQNVEEMLQISENSPKNSISGYMQYEKSVWGFNHMFLMTEDYKYCNEGEDYKDFSVEPELYGRMSRGEYLNVVTGNKEGKDVIYYMRTINPVNYNGKVITGVGLSFLMEDLLKEIDVSVLENKGNCYIIDTQGECIVHINSRNVERTDNILERIKVITKGKDEKQFTYLENMIFDRRSESIFIDTELGKYYITSMPMDENGWILLMTIPELQLSSNMNSFMIKTILCSVVIIGIIVTICILMCKLYSKKITQTKEEETLNYLEQALAAAQHSEKAKSRFLLSMSHDIRTPMNGIMGMSMLAKANIDNKGKVEYCLNKIDASANHLLQLINDVLDISKMESEKFHLNNQKFNLSDMLEEVVELTRIQAGAKSQNFVLDFDGGTEIEVWADMVGVKKILLNVLSNAVKYTDKGGNILFKVGIVKVTEKEVTILFVITDNGKGMEKAYINKIFDAFTREDKEEIKVIEGTGLGMAITKQLVEAMNGVIYVESEVGVGSRFSIELTLKKGEAVNVNKKSTEKEEAEKIDFSYQYKKILLVEDNTLNAEIMKEILSMAGAVVETASNGKNAVDIFEESPENYYDYILMDIQMPVMDGYTAVKNIRNLNRRDAKSIIILAMTANAFMEDIEKTKAAGMDGHVSKPIDMKILSGKLAEAERKRMRK